MTRLRHWPYWLPVLRGARGWLEAGAYVLGLYRRPQAYKYR